MSDREGLHLDLMGDKIVRVLNRNHCYHGVTGVMVPMGIESEALELRFLADTNEIAVIRHGMGLPEGGECVYSERMGE